MNLSKLKQWRREREQKLYQEQWGSRPLKRGSKKEPLEGKRGGSPSPRPGAGQHPARPAVEAQHTANTTTQGSRPPPRPRAGPRALEAGEATEAAGLMARPGRARERGRPGCNLTCPAYYPAWSGIGPAGGRPARAHFFFLSSLFKKRPKIKSQ